jgi:hypothetical protein
VRFASRRFQRRPPDDTRRTRGKMHSSRQKAQSQLISRRWALPEPDRRQFTLETVTRAHAAKIDREWPALRFPFDEHLHWKWRDICFAGGESFVLIGENGDPAGIWCSAKPKPITLPEGTFYRLDRLEAAPSHRGGIFGVFLFAVAATRAVETAANGMVLGALPAVASFYQGLGGHQVLQAGWRTDPDLVPFTFSRDTLLQLAEDIHELVVETSSR